MSEIANPLIILFSKQAKSVELYNIVKEIENFMNDNSEDINPEIFEELIDIKTIFENDNFSEEHLNEFERTIDEFTKRLKNGITNARLKQLNRARAAKIEEESNEDDELLSVRDVANELNLTRQQIYNKINNGEIPIEKVGERGTRIRKKTLKEYKEKYNKK
jgi:excisionase family DNA binding protein